MILPGLFDIPSGFQFPITVRVIRDTADSTVTTLQNGTVFSSLVIKLESVILIGWRFLCEL